MVKTRGSEKGMGRASSSTPSQLLVSLHRSSRTPISGQDQTKLVDPVVPLEPMPLNFMAPLELQLFSSSQKIPSPENPQEISIC